MAGVQHTTSTATASLVASAIAFTSAAVSDGFTFIFQLPAMIFLRIVLFLLFRSVWLFRQERGDSPPFTVVPSSRAPKRRYRTPASASISRTVSRNE